MTANLRAAAAYILTFLCSLVPLEAAGFMKNPYLIYPGDSSEMMVSWQADNTPANCLIEWGATTSYGSSSGHLPEPVNGARHYFHRITGLSSGTRYYYRVTIDGETVANSFVTAPDASATSLTVHACSDPHNFWKWNSGLEAFNTYVADDPLSRQTLFLYGGDYGQSDTPSQWQKGCHNPSYPEVSQQLQSMPSALVPGNHEIDCYQMKRYWPQGNLDRAGHYDGDDGQPDERDTFFSFDYGPLHVIGIDYYQSYAAGSGQYEYIRKKLSESASQPWKIAVCHERNTGWPLQELFAQYDVQLVQSGHWHTYRTTTAGGVTYVVCGEANNSQSPVYYMRYEMNGSTMTCRRIHQDGSVANTFTVNRGMTQPIAADDYYSCSRNGSMNPGAGAGVLGNDCDPTDDPLTASLVSGASNGSVSLNADGSFTYTPNAGYTGTDRFTYRCNDGSHNSRADATVDIYVGQAPTSTDDTYTVCNGAARITDAPGVLENDSDPDGDPLTAELVTDVSNGSLSLNADGSFTYTANGGYTGPDSFTYRARDGGADGDLATVNITVVSGNQTPTATADSYDTRRARRLVVEAPGVLGNDSDPEGYGLRAILVSDVSSGSLTLNPDGSFDYTPVSERLGPVTFAYRVNDGVADGNTVTVTITMNDPSPTAIYGLRGDMDDSSGNGLHGTLVNGTFVTDPDRGTVMELNGEGATTPMDSMNMREDFSVAFWIKVPDVDGDATFMITSGASVALKGDGMWGNNNSPVGSIWLGEAIAAGTGAPPPTPLDNNAWHHVVVTWDKHGVAPEGFMTAYVDGVRLTVAGTCRYEVKDSPVDGALLGDSGIIARMSDVRMYDEILSEAAVSDLFLGGADAEAPGAGAPSATASPRIISPP